LPYAVGASFSVIAVLFVPAQSIPLVLGGLIGVALGSGMAFGPASAQLADTADAVGLRQGPATANSIIAWPHGQVNGAVGGGGLAELAGELVTCLVIAGMLISVAVPTWLRVRRVDTALS